ncbi:hypothetical protein Pan44_50590 [Caulifigura coniformis]|uniref:PPi-type phosphoenolpyruvate carboxykinase lobe 2 domain-containing protein n=1 Tax=Caulifigura coniformis TaxID=2527983 RepID=A0A517SLJ7_9PLAN|nr:hypothetical protein [Caulifigura coniformis]QDT56995.1 hypothetical protein Pan44_50590 [Caulifigura coniformis]
MDSALTAGIRGVAVASPVEIETLRATAEALLSRPNLAARRHPADRRIEGFLNTHFADLVGDSPLRVPDAFALPKYGVARELSIPARHQSYRNEYVTSYRVRNGVLHNPRSDRRTTQGTFHVCEGGLPIPGDKKSVPRATFVALFRHALNAPQDLLEVPLTSDSPQPVNAFLSLLLRPIVCPEVPGVTCEKSMEVRFFAPGGLASNLDFVESIFGNPGDPWLAESDAALDVEHWTGHSGGVILAPHLTQLRKDELGLPQWDKATDRQRQDGMCWREPGELYNEGQAFKVTCRDATGVIVTIIADNYFGYCKKEVKTQISYAANLLGNVEEEHAGGALAFPKYNLGSSFDAMEFRGASQRTLEDILRVDGESLTIRAEGYAIDKECPQLVYVPHDARASVARLQFWWTRNDREIAIPLRPGNTYITPSGYKVHLGKHPSTGAWRLFGTVAEGLFCHKPCTVSGGGKSEISKSLQDYIQYGPILVSNFEKDMNFVEQILTREYSNRWAPEHLADYSNRPSRSPLSPQRSLGSVIKLLTPADEYSESYNAWLKSIPDYIFPIVYLIKAINMTQGDGDWRSLFSVDSINGRPGHELKGMGRRLAGSYLRVGVLPKHGWRTFKLRQDFSPAVKVQTEDDITASLVVPAHQLQNLAAGSSPDSSKFSVNCEYRLFQRPDDAIYPGLDRQTELDMSRPDNFVSNYEPLGPEKVQELVDRVTEFDKFTPPMRDLLLKAAGKETAVCSAYPRLVEGKPSKNPRYLQIRPDLQRPEVRYIAERGMRLARGIGAADPLPIPVGAVLIGRRNNPPDREAGIRPLAVYNPIHYQELPEFFMDVICSLTGKSPSTTGAGSEGALTKGPFNALRTIIDLNAALVSYILTGLGGFSTAAGYVGPDKRVDHDISLLVPEIWCRMNASERDPAFLIAEGHLEAVQDFEHGGRTILASRLGYRITPKFVRTFFGRIFDHPDRVFDEAYLRPETQDMEAFVDGMSNITEAQERVAQQAFSDGSIDEACPPLKALLAIMAHGSYEGMDAHHPAVRALFTREALEASDWYKDRLAAKQRVDVNLWRRHVASLENWLAENARADNALIAKIRSRQELAARELEIVRSAGYLASLEGTLGVQPSLSP